MSARIKVRPSPYLHGFIWWDCSVPLCPGGYGGGNTIAAAADAGRAHWWAEHATPWDKHVARLKRIAECHAPMTGLTAMQGQLNTVVDHLETSQAIYSRACGIGRDECLARHCDCAGTGSPPEAARPSDFVSTKSQGSSDLTTHNAVQDAHNLSREDY